MVHPAVTIRRVRTDGAVDELGQYLPRDRRLVMARPGFPLAPPGTHGVDGDLPWVFDEMAPDGFLATRFGRWFPALGLPARRDDWTAHHVLEALTRCGHDLSGNLLLGDETYQRYTHIFAAGQLAGPPRSSRREHYAGLVEGVLGTVEDSSVGGSRPKFALRLADGTGVIVKFTPPLDTATGRRWADLLRLEALAAEALRKGGLDTVRAQYFEAGERGYLEIERFDRVAGGGRLGHVTFYYLGVARYGEVQDPVLVASRLAADGYLTSEEVTRVGRLHAFSAAIANTDRHLGNYGLLIDDAGRTSLAPAYDVLPMALAPKHDELPDRRVAPMGPRAAETRDLVEQLIAAVRLDVGLSDGFRELWLRIVG